ncbi:Stf0 family sulfotransferase [Jannaschia formosa]|uniref:Stf0 family sulfotransferase n=1 Tax=Jannaschia formosa TaxID=2259592 RepID=UPI000E1BFCC3|nr:Stf0 family sulfotransferase [Jannaschia formosa]TFL17107.1 hypothetical protein DR046_16340 [Jannaschia formosa]
MRRLIPDRLARRLRPAAPAPAAPGTGGFPAAPAPDTEALAEDLARAPAPLGWVLHFTPRSGASWLCDIATGSGQLGRPVQSFEPRLMRRTAEAYNARSLDEYCELLPRKRARGGVWGLAVSYPQIRAAFPSEEDFLDRFGALPAVWLIRRDIVAQAVSLAKMRATGLAHAPQADAVRIAAADDDFRYDPGLIGQAMDRIRAAETATEVIFEAAGIQPLRMSYEENCAHPPAHLLKLIGHHAGRAEMTVRARSVSSKHVRIATAQNANYAERFREEEAARVAELEEARAPLLRAIAPYGPKRAPKVV